MSTADAAPTTEPRWIEREEGGTFSVEVNGQDREKREAAELAAFAVDAKLSVDVDSPRGRRASNLADFILVLLGSLPALFVADLVARLSMSTSPYPFVASFLAAWLLPVAALTLLSRRARAKRKAKAKRFSDRFTFTLAEGAFSFRGSARDEIRAPIEALQAVEGRRRGLVLVRLDGTRTELPCDLGSEDLHRELAARLTSELARARADARGYRGRLRVAEEPSPSESEAAEETDEADADRHASGS